MRDFLRRTFPEKTIVRWVLAGFYREKFVFFLSLFRSLKYNYRLTGRFLPLHFRVRNGQKLKLIVRPTANVMVSGLIELTPWGGEETTSTISLGDESVLNISGDFTIGPGVHISVSQGGHLSIEGRDKSTGSGITCNTRIMVRDRVFIGRDVIISWGVFISDSDWHEISWGKSTEPIFIGHHVWVSHDVSILKGSTINEGCVIGAKSLVAGKSFPERSLIAGAPAKVVREEISWSR